MTCTDDTSSNHATHKDIRANAEMAFAQTVTGSASVAVGLLSVGVAIETGSDPDQRPLYSLSLTGLVVATGLFIAWIMMRALRASCRERRHQQLDSMALSREQHLEMLGLAREHHAEDLALARAQHAELLKGFEASGERYAELIHYVTDFIKVQEREAEVIGDVLQFQRREER